ncbi:MAG: hypothetical protein ACXAC7_18715 [Candidatus Hodarchaeales archaeon]|jgi:hypothetical protein
MTQNSPNSADLFSPIIKSSDHNSETIFQENIINFFLIFGLGILHGLILGLMTLAAVIGIVENTIFGIAIWSFVVSFPLGLALKDFFKGIKISILSFFIWFFFTTIFLSIPGILGVVAEPDLFILGQIAYMVSNLLFVPGPVILGLAGGSVISELM